MNNLRNRGLEDILIAVVDGLKGFPDAINAAFPDTTVQTCIVHLVRHSLNFCGWRDRKAVAKDLKRIYQAVNDGEAAKALDYFEAEWGDKYPSIAPSWRRAWQEVIPFFAFPPLGTTIGPPDQSYNASTAKNHLHDECPLSAMQASPAGQ